MRRKTRDFLSARLGEPSPVPSNLSPKNLKLRFLWSAASLTMKRCRARFCNGDETAETTYERDRKRGLKKERESRGEANPLLVGTR